MTNERRAVLRLLLREQEWTYSQLQQELGLSERQVRRHLASLQHQDGIRLTVRTVERQKHFALAEEERPRLRADVKLSEREALALTVGLRAAYAMLSSTPIRAALLSARAKVIQHFEPETVYVELDQQDDRWYFGAIATNRLADGIFDVLLEGLEHERSLALQYAKPDTDGPERRVVDPLCIAVEDNALLLVGWCHKQQAFRDFALTRIRAVEVLEEMYFSRPDDFEALDYFAERFGSIATERVSDVELWADSKVAHLFLERAYHPTQQTHERDAQQRLRVTFRLDPMYRFRSFIQSWGTRVTVTKPHRLIQALREEAEALAATYRAP